jgi:sigma-B regulation protein RsbU (phosphoserine phosphatase)
MFYPRSRVYRALIVLGAMLAFLFTLRDPYPPLDWRVVGIFALLSLGVKRAGFRVAAEVTHSLVNVVDVAALLLTGPIGGAIVAVISTILHVQISFYRRGSRTWNEMVDLPLFDGAVKVLTALAAGYLYLELGGVLRPSEFRINQLLPLATLYATWFVIDHFFWVVLVWIAEGRNSAVAFLERIGRASLLIELAPLPMALPLAAAWQLFDPLLRFVTLLAVFLVAVLVRAFTNAVARSESRVKAVNVLNKFGQQLAQGQPDEERVVDLLYQYAIRILPEADYELILLNPDGTAKPMLLNPSQESMALPLLDYILPLLKERSNARLLGDLSRYSLAVEAQRSVNERPSSGGAVLMPLLSGDTLLGLFVAKSKRPYGLTTDDGRSLSILATQATISLQNSRHFRQEARRVRQLATIAEVSRMVASVIKLDDLLWQVANLIQDNFGYYHVQIYLVDYEANEVVYRAGSGTAGRGKFAANPPRLQLGKEGIIGWVAAQGMPLIVPDVSQESRYIHRSERLLPDVRSELAVPLKIEERVLGVLDVQSDTLGDLDDEDQFTLTTLADQLAIAIEEAQLYVAQRETAWVTTGLLQVAEALNPLYELTAIMDRVVRVTPPLIGVESAVIYLWQEKSRQFVKGSSFGLPVELVAGLNHSPLFDHQLPLLMELRQKSRLIFVDKAASHEPRLGQIGKVLGSRGVVLARMESQGDFVGVLLVATSKAPTRLSERRQTLLAGIAQQVAVAIQAAQLYVDQEESAMITRDLLGVAEKIAGRTDLNEILEQVTRLTVTLTGVKHCAVYRWDERHEQFIPRAATGFTPEVEEAWKSTMLPAHEIPALAVLYDSSEPVPLAGKGKRGAPSTLCTLFEADHLLGVPLRARESFMGMMVIDVDSALETIPNRLRAILMGLARQLSIALENQTLYEDALENERRTQELVLARQVQGALIPERSPSVPEFDIAGYWRPAREVGGDFYDYVWVNDERIAFSIADVADKGMAAALFMVLARTALRESLWSEEDAGRAMTRTNALLTSDARGGMFLTTFLAILSPREGVLQAANAGHLPPLLYDAKTDTIASLVRRNMPMGILSDVTYSSFRIFMEPGDFIVLFTDGLPDSTSPTGELLGMRRVAELVYENRHLDSNALIEVLRDAAVFHASGEAMVDDLTMVVVRREPPTYSVETE